MNGTIKPRTRKRIAERRTREREAGRKDLVRRMTAAANEHGPESIYAEMLEDLERGAK